MQALLSLCLILVSGCEENLFQVQRRLFVLHLWVQFERVHGIIQPLYGGRYTSGRQTSSLVSVREQGGTENGIHYSVNGNNLHVIIWIWICVVLAMTCTALYMGFLSTYEKLHGLHACALFISTNEFQRGANSACAMGLIRGLDTHGKQKRMTVFLDSWCAAVLDSPNWRLGWWHCHDYSNDSQR